MTDLTTIDGVFYLMGDEDGDVSLMCRVCDRGGLPVAFLTSDTRVTAYHDKDVVVAHLISEFFTAGATHQSKLHPQ